MSVIQLNLLSEARFVVCLSAPGRPPSRPLSDMTHPRPRLTFLTQSALRFQRRALVISPTPGLPVVRLPCVSPCPLDRHSLLQDKTRSL